MQKMKATKNTLLTGCMLLECDGSAMLTVITKGLVLGKVLSACIVLRSYSWKEKTPSDWSAGKLCSLH